MDQNQFIGEIRMFAGDFAPVGWAFCHGQMLYRSQYAGLYSILKTNYGGDENKGIFLLPDLRGRVPIHVDAAQYLIGTRGGTETTTLRAGQLPEHTHPVVSATLFCTTEQGNSNTPSDCFPASNADNSYNYMKPEGNTFFARDAIVAKTKPNGGAPINNMMPYLGISFIIALEGILPNF